MASFSDLGNIAKDLDFQRRVNYAMTVAAVNVYAELTNITGHPARLAFALKVFSGNFNIMSSCLLVLTNSTISAGANAATTPGFAIVDGDIQFAVNSLWNDFSGV